MFAKKTDLAAAFILAIFFVILTGVSAKNSATFEENNHLSTGYYFLKTNDYRMGPGHPPLTYKIAALPLLFLKLNFPFENSYCRNFLYYGCAEQFLYKSGANAPSLIFLARMPFILLTLITGYFVFRWAKELYGQKAGLLALLFYSLSPAVLGWSALIMTDFSVAAFSFISTYFLWRLMQKPSMANLSLTGLFLGLAIASKFTAALFLPIYACIAAFWFLSGKPYNFPKLERFLPRFLRNQKALFLTSMAIAFVIAFIVLWAAYGFDTGNYSSGAPERYTNLVYENIPPQFGTAAQFLIEKFPLPFPSFFVGVSEQMFISATSSKQSFILGNTYNGSVWYFHVLEFLVKVPLAFLILLLISTAMLLINRKSYKSDVLFLLVPAAIYYVTFALLVNIGSGIQHILPVFPFLFVFAGRITLSKKPLQLLVYGLAAWYVISSLSAFPHYISYFNEYVDNSEGYRYFLGANLDLGQNLKGLSDYAKEKNLRIKLSYFGTTDPKAYIDYEYMPSPFFLPWVPGFAHSEEELAANYTEDCSRQEGIIAISVTNREGAFMLNSSCYDWLKGEKPTEIIGNTIFVYNITS